MEKSIIIIGAGLTGLSAGCYGRMNGYRTSIFEMHDMAGGVCTAWKRKGYTIDGAMNWLIGTNPVNDFYRFWEELGAAPRWKVYNHDRYIILENKEGKSFTIYCDANRFESYLLELAPEDRETIRELTNGIRTASRMSMPVDKPSELYGYLDKIKMVTMLPAFQFIQKWTKVSFKEFAGRFKSTFVRDSLLQAFGEGFPVFMILWMLGYQHARSAGYVLGGALELVSALEKRYADLGGEVHYKSKVEKILVENDRAVGVRLADGTEHRADWVISASDGRTTIFDMLDGKYIDDDIRQRYEKADLFAPLVYVALGVDRAFEDVPPSISGLTYPLEKPITVAGKEHETLNIRLYNFDPSFSPEGKNVAVVGFDSDFDYWKSLKEKPEEYRAEKERIARDVIERLEQRFPGITGQVEMMDVATPVTWERYTGNWRGSYEGWMYSTESFTSSMSKTLPGLEGFYMAGQWVNPGGGMPTAAMSGNHTIQLICNSDRKNFVASKPKSEKEEPAHAGKEVR